MVGLIGSYYFTIVLCFCDPCTYCNISGFLFRRLKNSFESTVKILNFGMSEIFAVIYLKIKQRGQTLGYLFKMVQMEQQIVKTLIRLLL